ncbi:hypothetical protein J4212_00915 [Candidatus Woesearchaeota archaeon]|nr:hypothetical protein [Candidatus Woesearchaeota archaeon]
MQKRGQVISFDLVLSTFIFLGALMFILYQIDNASFQKTQDLSFAEGSVINNLWLNMKNPAYGQTFLADSHIDEAKLQIFESKAYRDAVPDQNFFNDQKSLVLHNLGVAGFAVDFCLYFVNGSGNIKGIGPKAGTGQEDNAGMEIFVGRNDVRCEGAIGSNEPYEDPHCSQYYSHAFIDSRPVIRNREIMSMKILVCAKEAG